MVLGRNWQHASDMQRHDYVILFRGYTLDTLSQRIGYYTGSQRFVVKGSRPAGADDVIVTTQVLYTDHPPLEIAWRIRSKQRLMIVDVIVEQISMGGFRDEAQRVKQSGFGRLCQAPRVAPGAG